jgi:hypothetical protein
VDHEGGILRSWVFNRPSEVLLEASRPELASTISEIQLKLPNSRYSIFHKNRGDRINHVLSMGLLKAIAIPVSCDF